MEQDGPSYQEILGRALRLLSRREHTELELRKKLSGGERGADVVQEVIEGLKRDNYLSDERFTESFVRFRFQRYQGPLKIKAALRTKGVSEHLISRELEARSEEWTGLACQWLERQNIGVIDFDAKKKYYRRLKSRGFTHAQSMDALNQS